MTSESLYQYVRHKDVLRQLQRDLEPLEVYLHASLAQAELLRETEILTVEQAVTFVANQEVYTSATAGWSFLSKVLRVIAGTNSDYKPIQVRDKRWVDNARHDGNLQSIVQPNPPIAVYHLLTEPISLGFYGVPLSATTATLSYVRVHTSTDDIAELVNPIVPDQWKDLLIEGTALQMLRGQAFEVVRTVGRGKVYENFLLALGRTEQRYEQLKRSAILKRAALTSQDAQIYRRVKI